MRPWWCFNVQTAKERAVDNRIRGTMVIVFEFFTCYFLNLYFNFPACVMCKGIERTADKCPVAISDAQVSSVTFFGLFLLSAEMMLYTYYILQNCCRLLTATTWQEDKVATTWVAALSPDKVAVQVFFLLSAEMMLYTYYILQNSPAEMFARDRRNARDRRLKFLHERDGRHICARAIAD